MRKKRQVRRIFLILWSLAAMACLGKLASAQDEDPPSRVARLSYEQGSVSFEPAGTDDWVAPGINRPVTIGDKIWVDNDGRAELQLDGSVIRAATNTGFSFLNLNDSVTQIQLTAGTILVRVRRLDRNETYEIDTPNLAFSVLRPGTYRIRVDENGDQTALAVRSGEGEITGGGSAYTVRANESYVFSGTDQLYANRESFGEDQLEAWANTRDRHWASARSANYVSEDVIGYEDLDDHGTWRDVPEYGGVWFPRVETADWAPYHYGHWCYVEPWGYTWVDDESWGFAPFHYGRWVHYGGLWGWVPAPRHVEQMGYVRPVYAPALVAWVGGGAMGGSVGWFPLGPREVYVPSYAVSRTYVDRVNITNTTVNTTVINNYYNTTVVNSSANVTNVKYVNREVPGAIAATTSQAFTGAQPVARNRVQVNPNAAAGAGVRPVAPSIAPLKQTVLGNAPARSRPPAAVQTRTVVAKSAPPPAPPRVDQRLAAVEKNGGKPLSVSQMRQMAPATAEAHPSVKVVPAAKPSATPPPAPPNRAGQPPNPPPFRSAPNAPSAVPPANRPAERPPNGTPPPARPSQPAPNPAEPPNRPAEHPPAKTPEPARPAHNPPTPPPPRNDRPSKTAPVHPSEEPPPARTAPPPSNNPAVNQQHQNEQDQLRARQEKERQQLQQQQEKEHAQATQQQANQKQRQQMEQRHQQQTQQQQQKHAQEQQQQKQQQERQAQEKKKPQQQQQPPEPKS